MAETVDSVPEEGATQEAIREGLADVRRELTELVACEAQLAASAHRRELRRLGVDAAARWRSRWRCSPRSGSRTPRP